MTANEKVDKNNDISSEKYDESAVCNHGTPVTSRQGANNAEESLEPDLYSSPVLPPCTQEGGNEVAWDWQNSPESRNKKRNVHCETPKGTKLLQKKRNSDSPLLYKPIKRKTINMESIENIGQFAAELQALTEKMSVIKHIDQNHLDNQVEKEEVPILADTNIKEEVPTIEDKQNCVGEINDHKENDYVSKKEANYDDLFDDSIDDDMIRCTQEIEEKLKSIADKKEGNSTHSEPSVKKEESYEKPGANNASDKNSVQSTSNESFRELSAENIFHSGTTNNNTLKTYSKLSKRDSNSNVQIAERTDKNNLYKSYRSNNAIHSSIRSTCDKKMLSKAKATKSLDFPDDSFDDCLAACIEDDKSLSFDSLVSSRNESTKFEASYERLTRAPLKLEVNSLKGDPQFPSMRGQVSSSSSDKKFFKTKSLSDHYLNQNASKSNATRPTLHLNPTAKSSTITLRNVTRASVSTNPIVTTTGDREVTENHAISLTRGADRTRPNGSDDVNRCAIKGGDGFVRHHSTGNIRNDTKQMSKTGSQPARCTPEEIERKRQQALMRLEAKRKLYAEMKSANNVNR